MSSFEINVKNMSINYMNIYCQLRDSCSSMTINIKYSTVHHINIYCMDTWSCSPLYINSIQSIANIEINCIVGYSCNDMLINADDDGIFINLIMYEYSNSIKVTHPNVTNINMSCDNPENKRYVKYFTNELMDEQQFSSLAREEYASYRLPCEGIQIDCTSNPFWNRDCRVKYKLNSNTFDLSKLMETRDYIYCYWLEISETFDIICEGNCDDTVIYYQYNVSVDFDIEFENDPKNITTQKSAYSICDTYFGDINVTMETLGSMTAIFESILSFLSFNDPFTLHRITHPPETDLRTGASMINCTYQFDVLQIVTNMYILSGIGDQNEFDQTFDEDSAFVEEAQQLLSEFFDAPIALIRITSLTENGISEEIVIGIICGSICIIIMILSLSIYSRRKQKMKRELLTTYIQNPLVIAIAIGKYHKIPTDPDVADCVFNNLDAIENDIKNINALFGVTLNYKIFPKYDADKKIRTHWNKKQIMDLLHKKAKYLDKSVEDNKHDALVVVISCHGIPDHIVTSDYKKINKDTIHRIFSVDFPSLRHIPGIFIYDCCDGENDRVRNQSRLVTESPLFPEPTTRPVSHSKGTEIPLQKDRQVMEVYGADKQRN